MLLISFFSLPFRALGCLNYAHQLHSGNSSGELRSPASFRPVLRHTTHKTERDIYGSYERSVLHKYADLACSGRGENFSARFSFVAVYPWTPIYSAVARSFPEPKTSATDLWGASTVPKNSRLMDGETLNSARPHDLSQVYRLCPISVALVDSMTWSHTPLLLFRC